MERRAWLGSAKASVLLVLFHCGLALCSATMEGNLSQVTWPKDREILDEAELYTLRCRFPAHPSGIVQSLLCSPALFSAKQHITKC
jgi:hypothetical protein